VNEERLDQALGQVIQAAFCPSREQEDALWSRLAQRRRQDECAWSAFMTIMLRASASVRKAIEWSAWPAHGVPGIC
jgi:hypothetical protein